MSDKQEFKGIESDNSCHICYRDMDNFNPREGVIHGDGYVEYEKGIGTCPEHGVSYSALSMKPPERGNCHCSKEDCPVCGGEEE